MAGTLESGCDSRTAADFDDPFVPKNFAESGQTTYVHPPWFGLFSSLAEKDLFSMKPMVSRSITGFGESLQLITGTPGVSWLATTSVFGSTTFDGQQTRIQRHPRS